MDILLLIILITATVVIIMAIDTLCKNKTSSYTNIQNENIKSVNETAKQQTITKLIERQNTIYSLTALNTILLSALITIIVFIIVKIYPYLDTLKEYYQLLESMKEWIN